MYDKKKIDAHNADELSFAVAQGAAEVLRTESVGFGEYLNTLVDDRCSIHKPVSIQDTGGGCGSVPTGSHPSVEALYAVPKVHVCHAHEGVRRVDIEFARKVSVLDSDFVSTALKFGDAFRNRYLAGSEVNWRRYGKGYCYLQLLHPNARHRVARILGPFPFVRDVARFAVVVGNWGNEGFTFESVMQQQYHVVTKNWSPKTSMRSALSFMLQCSSKDVIGGETSFSATRNASLFSAISVQAGYINYLPFDHTKFDRCVSPERYDLMHKWAISHDIDCFDGVISSLLAATTASVTLQAAGSFRLCETVKLWQVVGDLVSKHFVLMHVMSSAGTVKDFANLTGKSYQSNAAMSAALVTSDLKPCCFAPFLCYTSKAWADMLEGAIGVIAMTQSTVVLKNCLVHFNLLPKVHVATVEIVSDTVLPVFDSRLWTKFAIEVFNRTYSSKLD